MGLVHYLLRIIFNLCSFGAEIPEKLCPVFLRTSRQKAHGSHLFWVSFMVNLDHLSKVLSSRFLFRKVPLSCFAVNKYLVKVFWDHAIILFIIILFVGSLTITVVLPLEVWCQFFYVLLRTREIYGHIPGLSRPWEYFCNQKAKVLLMNFHHNFRRSRSLWIILFWLLQQAEEYLKV